MKVTKNRATREIRAAAGRLSAGLLGHENVAFAGIGRSFADIPEIRMRTVKGLRNNWDARTELVDAFRVCLFDAQEHVVRLSQLAAGRGLAAVKAELLWCERALPARYRGLTAEAASRVKTSGIAAGRVWVWRAEVAQTPMWFQQALTHQLGQAADMDELKQRLFSRTPAKIRGHAQTGVWWLPLSSITAAARAVSIGTANDVKVAVMTEFNRLADDV